jgi:hypothetical protein
MREIPREKFSTNNRKEFGRSESRIRSVDTSLASQVYHEWQSEVKTPNPSM